MASRYTYSPDQPATPVAVSTGQFLLLLLVVVIVSAVVAVGVVFLAQTMMPGGGGFRLPFGASPPQWSTPPSHGHSHGEAWSESTPWAETAPGTPWFSDDARWSEGESTAQMVRNAVEVYRVRHDNDLSGLSAGPILELADQLGLDADDFGHLEYFNASDFRLVINDKDADAAFTIEVESTHPNGPAGTYRVHNNGNEEFWS